MKISIIFFWFAGVFLFFNLGCTLPYQMRSYTEYRLHDLKVDGRNILVLLEKENYRPEIEISGAIMGEMSGKTAYDFRSFYLISFGTNNFTLENQNQLQLKGKTNIANRIKHSSNIRSYIIDKNRLFFSTDIINNEPFSSIVHLNNVLISEHIAKIVDIKQSIMSFDRKKYLYISDKYVFLYDTEKNKSIQIESKTFKDSFHNNFINTRYMSDVVPLFFDYIGGDIKTNLAKFIISDKINNIIIGTFSSSYLNIQDFYEKDEESRILAYDPFVGLEIFDINGNSLYALHQNSLSFIQRAVMHNDKVYAAGLVSKEEAFGKAQYIQILVWDYKNGTITRKNYPCDNPELEM